MDPKARLDAIRERHRLTRPAKAYCTQCDRYLEDLGPNSGHYQRVTGWVKLRARGANQVALRQSKPVFMCRECMDAMRIGIDPNQNSLF